MSHQWLTFYHYILYTPTSILDLSPHAWVNLWGGSDMSDAQCRIPKCVTSGVWKSGNRIPRFLRILKKNSVRTSCKEKSLTTLTSIIVQWWVRLSPASAVSSPSVRKFCKFPRGHKQNAIISLNTRRWVLAMGECKLLFLRKESKF